jgi:LuxR family maltose regulon positive regulatory protein
MEGFTSYPWAPLVELLGLAARALAVAMQGDPQRSAESAERAFTQAREWGLDGSQVGGAVALAMGVGAMRLGRTREAQPLLEAALRQWGGRPGTLPRAYVALWLAGAVAANGEAARARDLAREARAIVSRSPDPGAIPSLLEQVERALRVPSGRATPRSDVPTEAEIRVLRLLAGTSSRSEIARQLFLSPNTVKSHVKAINRKLGTSSRAEAVARAREMDII